MSDFARGATYRQWHSRGAGTGGDEARSSRQGRLAHPVMDREGLSAVPRGLGYCLPHESGMIPDAARELAGIGGTSWDTWSGRGGRNSNLRIRVRYRVFRNLDSSSPVA